MGGLPFFQFYPADYMRDTRALSCAAKGGWVDILCMLHGSSTRGTLTLPIVGWARIFGATVEQTEAILAELAAMHVADLIRGGNGDVTISSRRMLRESITREQTRLRVQRHRGNTTGNASGNGDVTPNKPETRSQNIEESLRSSSSAEPAAPTPAGELPLGPVGTDPATDPIAMVFPTVGKLAEWPLRQSKVAEYRATFPGVDVAAALREARLWCVDNKARRKTASGMPKFLFGWLERRQNRAPNGNAAPPGPVVRSPNIYAEPPNWREHARVKWGDAVTLPSTWNELSSTLRNDLVAHIASKR